jgi:hypothetical protein
MLQLQPIDLMVLLGLAVLGTVSFYLTREAKKQ